MLNSQLLNNLSDFFTAFKELATLAKTDELDTVVAGLADAKDTLSKHSAAKADLQELEKFKSSKEEQMAAIKSAQDANQEAASLNTKHAKDLIAFENSLISQKSDHQKNVSALADDVKKVKAREDAVIEAEKKANDTQAEADQALRDANDLKQSYVNKLKTLSQAEGAQQ